MGKKEDKIMEEVVYLLPSEIKDMTKRGLRAARIPAGYSPAAEAMVASSEIYGRVGLTSLRQLLASDLAPPIRVHLVSDTGLVAQVDALHQANLLCAPSIFDFAYARTRKIGRYFLTARNVQGGFQFLPELTAYNARRGIGTAVMWSSKNTAGSIFALPQPEASFATPKEPELFYETSQQRQAHQQLFDLKVDRHAPKSEELLAAYQTPQDSSHFNADIANSFSLYCFTSDTDSKLFQSYLTEHRAEFTHLRPKERQQLWKTAEQEGVEVTGELWRQIKGYGNQILIEATAEE